MNAHAAYPRGTSLRTSPERPLHIIDCTLREGEQTPGVWLEVDEKLLLVDMLARAGLTMLDAGMPEIGEEERRFFRQATGRTTALMGASVRLRPDAVQLALNAGCDALFIICPCSPLHREVRLGLTLSQLQRQLELTVRVAAGAGKILYLVAEDSARTPISELIPILQCGLNAGVQHIVLCDTVGVLMPGQMAQQVVEVRDALGPHVALGIHCHNDFGLATANTLAGIEAGVDYPTVCVNGIGERSGNASLAEVMAGAELLLHRSTGIDPTHLPALSAAVERLTGLIVPPHQPIVGYNAHRHESGIHVDGLLKGAETYEPIPPAWVGASRRLVFGKHSGKAQLQHLATQKDLSCEEESLVRVLERLKARGPGQARAAFQAVRAALTEWEAQHLGIPEGEVIALLEGERDPLKRKIESAKS